MNIIAVLTLVLSLYLLHKADKLKKNKEIYAFAGLVALLWSLAMLSGAYVTAGILPLAFSLAAIGALVSKGGVQTVCAAIAFIIFLVVVL